MKRHAKVGARVALLLAAALTVSGFAGAKPECIAPAAPGGGWDFTCRTVGRLLHELKIVDRPIQVTNMPGAVGAVAFAHVSENRMKDGNLIVAASSVGMTQIAQKRYPGDAERMRWLGMLGADTGVVMVKADSPYKTLADLINAMKANPGVAVTGGSSGAGGYDHLRLLLVARAAGIPGPDLRKIRWVQFDGGSSAVTQMLGGHIGVVTTDLGEISGFVESGQVRVLAALSQDRLPGKFANLPTAREQGYDVVGLNWRGFYTGGQVTDAEYAKMVDGLKRLYDTDEWKKTAEASGLTPNWIGGKDFEAYVRKSVADLRSLSLEIGVIK
ncbi:putative tricarboxylic transport membrane protein [Stella humosa]|uniref:Putative tricarboxylic transport membrane protein n=1 Tax=Stella humosa TaxID=94 RepID=A0A3N1MAJ6_9PROT|nr:tripartite tricarboxylate transporter substrate-binding protein [Stella humosa]ROQ00289.1 putative tricarboxylic transport membrane protein [Stella humosa]BBK30473.1 tricarboxylic transport membrane protein [Stella humosa]